MSATSVPPFKGSFILVILILASSLQAFHSKAENLIPAILTLDIEDGVAINDEFTFKATVTDDLEPRSASWELFDSTSTRQYVSLSDFGQDITNGPSKEWSFEIEIFPELLGPCSCILIVSVIDSNDILLVESTSIFIQFPGVAEEEFTPTLHILDDGIDNWHSQSYALEALSSTIDGNVPSFSTIIRRSTPIKCVYEGPEAENSLYSVNHNMTMQSNFSDFEWDGHTVTFKINLVNFDD